MLLEPMRGLGIISKTAGEQKSGWDTNIQEIQLRKILARTILYTAYVCFIVSNNRLYKRISSFPIKTIHLAI